MAKKILIVDDEQDIISLLKYNLRAEGYDTIAAKNGEDAVHLAFSEKPDLVLLDIMLPGLDGYEVIKELRRNPATEHTPVIFLTAKDSEFDEVLGLELGADDYIVKPISLRKLMARIKKALRKTAKGQETSSVLRFENLEIDPDSHMVKVAGKNVTMTKKEFGILLHLAKHPGRVVSRDILLNEIWGENIIVVDRTIDVHIRNIRDKLEDQKDYIETIKGVGYRFKVKDS